MEDITCSKCGEVKFEVYIDNKKYLRCICEKTIEEFLENNGIMIKGINKE